MPSLIKGWNALVLAVAAAMVALMLIPAHVWRHPADEAAYRGFDRNLVYVTTNRRSSRDLVDVSADRLSVRGQAGNQSIVDLTTSPLAFRMTLRIQILDAPTASHPLQVLIWNPSTASGYSLSFGPQPTGLITEDLINHGAVGRTLSAGQIIRTRSLGSWTPGHPISLTIDRGFKKLQVGMSSDGMASSDSVSSNQFPDLFSTPRVTVALLASGGLGDTRSVISDYTLTLAVQPDSAAQFVRKSSDPRALVLVLLLAGLGLLAVAVSFARLLGRWKSSLLRLRHGVFRGLKARLNPGWPSARWWLTVLAAVMLLTVYVLGNVRLFPLGSPHFDIYASKIWAYIAEHYSFLDLYHRPLLTPAAAVEGGIPYHEAVFPYGPTKVYYYWVIGEISRWLPLGSGASDVNSFRLEFILKSANLAFGLLDGALVYLILRTAGAKRPHAIVASGLLIFNPAVWFVMSVWGSTETVSLFFIFLSIWLAQTSHPAAAWTALLAGAFTRPQMLVLAFLLSIVYLRRFQLRSTVTSVATAVIVGFLALTPLALAIGPSVPVDYVSNVLGFSVGTSGADPSIQGVSPGYYSIWTLVVLLLDNQHGLSRMWYPRTSHFTAQLTLGQVSALLSIGVVLLIGVILLVKIKPGRPLHYQFPWVTTGMLTWLMVTSLLVSRYFLYALGLAVICLRSIWRPIYGLVILLLTGVSLLTSWGHLALDVQENQLLENPLNPAHSAASHWIVSVFTSDPIITFGAIANLLVLALLIACAVSQRTGPASSGEPGVITAHENEMVAAR